jgi:hypothetical protein
LPVTGDQSEDPACLASVAADRFAHIQADEIYHHQPSRPENVNVRGWMVGGDKS